MKSAITIRLDPDLEKLLARVCRETGRTRSDLVRDALRRQLSLLRFERLRRRALPFAEARGYLTESALPIRDKDDRWVFASAVEGRAEVFVTGDRDLLDVAGAAPLKIVDPRGFWQLSRNS